MEIILSLLLSDEWSALPMEDPMELPPLSGV